MSTRRGHGEGSIYKRADGRWCGVVDLGYVEGKRKRKTVYGKTRHDVAYRMTTVLKARLDGTAIVAEQKTVGAFLGEWLKTVEPVVRPTTYRRYEEYVRLHIKPTLGQARLARLKPQDLQQLYAERLQAGVSPTTVHHIHRVLHRALKQAMRWGLVAHNVAAAVDAPRRATKEMRSLSPEETRRFLDAINGERVEALYVLAVTAGLRQGELLALHWRDVDLDTRTVRVTGTLQSLPGRGLTIAPPKTGKSRRQVVLSELAVEALRRHRAAQAEERLALGSVWEDHDLVFANSVGKPINASNLFNRSWATLLERAELPRIRFHDLRHTAATLLLGAGIHPKVVSEMLGHSTISITLDLYSHVTPTMQHQAADAVDTLLGCQLGCQTGTE